LQRRNIMAIPGPISINEEDEVYHSIAANYPLELYENIVLSSFEEPHTEYSILPKDDPIGTFSNISLPQLSSVSEMVDVAPEPTSQMVRNEFPKDPIQMHIDQLQREMQTLITTRERILHLYATQPISQPIVGDDKWLLILSLQIEDKQNKINLLEKEREIAHIQTMLELQKQKYHRLDEYVGDMLLNHYIENREYLDAIKDRDCIISSLKVENSLYRERLQSLLPPPHRSNTPPPIISQYRQFQLDSALPPLPTTNTSTSILPNDAPQQRMKNR